MTKTRSAYMHPALKGRIFLDYPLDLLLNRECSLAQYGRYNPAGFPDVLDFVDALEATLTDSNGPVKAGGREALLAVCAAQLYASSVNVDGIIKELKRKSQWSKTALDGLESLISAYLEGWGRLTEHARHGAVGALSLPDEARPGTGNILILGAPGTGKTTLALQIAVAATCAPNAYSSLFLPLEESQDALLARCANMGWENRIHLTRFHDSASAASSPAELALALRRELTQPTDCPASKLSTTHVPERPCVKHAEVIYSNLALAYPQNRAQAPRVLVGTLSPRNLLAPAAGEDRTFWTRYQQLERLLLGFECLRTTEPGNALPEMRIICIDSLNVFGDGPLSREHLFRITDLCRRYHCLGVFTAEEGSTAGSTPMEYLCDVVIKLHATEEAGYALRHLEITKSQYQHQVYGRHPFKLRSLTSWRQDVSSDAANAPVATPNRLFQALVIHPSIHHVLASTRHRQRAEADRSKATVTPGQDCLDSPFDIGVDALKYVLLQGIRRPCAITIAGPRGTYKSSIAQNFLLAGLCSGESGLLVRFREHPQFSSPGTWHPSGSVRARWRPEKCAQEDAATLDDSKLLRRVWQYSEDEQTKGTCLVELNFKQGALLAEEFLEFVRDVYREYSPSRVVLDDISLIGTSFPFLRHSRTAGDLCLAALIHVSKHHGADLVMAGTLSGSDEADSVVHRGCTLSDTVLETDFCDVFGDRLVIVTGEGLMAGGRDPVAPFAEPGADHALAPMCGEVVPGVVVNRFEGRPGKRWFDVDLTLLEGLVGFNVGDIHRPGLVLHLFSEGAILSRYNAEIRTMLERSFAAPRQTQQVLPDRRRGRPAEAQKVTVYEFDSGTSEALHDSLRILKDKPVDKTVLYAVDEFYFTDEDPRTTTSTWLRHIDRRELAVPERIEDGDDTYFITTPDRVEGQPVTSVPYYANVLVFAYDTTRLQGFENIVVDERGVPRVHSWGKLASTLSELPAPPFRHDGSDGGASDGVVDFGAWSSETLACIFIDAVLSGRGEPGTVAADVANDSPFDAKKLRSFDTGRGEVALKLLLTESHGSEDGALTELLGLCSVFKMSSRYGKLPPQPGATVLSPTAAAFVCWYSQLRELLNDNPQLERRINVAALPGWGFRGDWFVGIADGSVSQALGMDVLRILCSDREEYKRFVRGVGLPVRRRYLTDPASDFLAWPGSSLKLKDMLRIHQCARTRSCIRGYQEFRFALGTLGRQLAFLSGDPTDVVRNCLERVPNMIRFLSAYRSGK